MQVLTCAPPNAPEMLTHEDVTRFAEQAGLKDPSIVLKRLDAAGPEIEIEPWRPLYPASMLKTPLALAALTLVQDGELDLAATYEVVEANMTANDKPSPLVPGYASPLHEIVELAITRSDNVATNMLYDIIGRDRATQIADERYGLNGTAFRRKLSGSLPLIHDAQWDGTHMNKHPAGDAARLFELIARSQVPFAGTLHRTLARQEWNNKLSPALERADTFAHKTGDTDEVSHDGGILETASGATYVIVVYTGLASSDANSGKLTHFMRELRKRL